MVLLVFPVFFFFNKSPFLTYFFLVDFNTQKTSDKTSRPTSVTRLGDFLHFGQLFKAFGYNYFAQIIFGATLIDIWRFLSGHTASDCT